MGTTSDGRSDLVRRPGHNRPRAAPAAPARVRSSDPSGRPAPLPAALAPQLATWVERVPSDGDWIYELKFDGYRLLARIDGTAVRLFTRNGHDWTAKLPGLARQVAALGLEQAWLDGEIVVAGEDGLPDFQRLQNSFDAQRTDDVDYFVFDLPFHAGLDLRGLPLCARRERLRALMEAAQASGAPARVQFSEDFPVPPADLLATACELKLEGLIGKRADAPYTSSRSGSWIKLKCTQRQEFVIAGFTDPRGTRAGFGALLLGVQQDGRLRYAGKVGSGFDNDQLHALRGQLDALAAARSPFQRLPQGVSGHWVRPTLVAEVSFAQWTRDGLIRHAVFHGLRRDKPARAVGLERATDVASLIGNVRVSHPDRVIDESTGITKLDLVRYYRTVAPQLLPHLARRPVSLVRAPQGITGELFFQKHGEQLGIPGIKSLPPHFDPGHAPLLEVPNLRALLGAAQMNVIEFHTWNANTRSIDKPDRMSFDLDPGEGVPWSKVQEAAQLVRALLQELGLESFLKTSGGKGLHVVVPLRPQHGWDIVKGLSQAIVRHLALALPERFAAKSGPRRRVGKIFADYLRNGRGATTAAAWSARARPGMGVSVPVGWDELSALRGGAHWTVRTAQERLDIPDPWAGVHSAGHQTLAAAFTALDFVVRPQR